MSLLNFQGHLWRVLLFEGLEDAWELNMMVSTSSFALWSLYGICHGLGNTIMVYLQSSNKSDVYKETGSSNGS